MAKLRLRVTVDVVAGHQLKTQAVARRRRIKVGVERQRPRPPAAHHSISPVRGHVQLPLVLLDGHIVRSERPGAQSPVEPQHENGALRCRDRHGHRKERRVGLLALVDGEVRHGNVWRVDGFAKTAANHGLVRVPDVLAVAAVNPRRHVTRNRVNGAWVRRSNDDVRRAFASVVRMDEVDPPRGLRRVREGADARPHGDRHREKRGNAQGLSVRGTRGGAVGDGDDHGEKGEGCEEAHEGSKGSVEDGRVAPDTKAAHERGEAGKHALRQLQGREERKKRPRRAEDPAEGLVRGVKGNGHARDEKEDAPPQRDDGRAHFECEEREEEGQLQSGNGGDGGAIRRRRPRAPSKEKLHGEHSPHVLCVDT
eukprot:Opistho-1_new@107086